MAQTLNHAPTTPRRPGRTAKGGVSHRAQRRREQARRRVMRRLGYSGVGVIAVGLVALAILLPGPGGTGHDETAGMPKGAPAVGAKAPAFSLTDVVSGNNVTLASLAGQKTLMFFSEGVSCQACMVQAANLQDNKALTGAGIRLVSVTTDSAGQLSQAAGQYGIRTPLLSDATTSASAAYGMLGHGGMQHATQDGHAFMLLGPDGKVLWHRAYQSMYVEPGQLLSDMGVKA